MQSTGEKQFTLTNIIADNLVSSLKNFNVLMEFKKRYYGKSCVKNEFRTEEFLKTTNDADQNDLETRCLTIARGTSCFTFKAVIQ